MNIRKILEYEVLPFVQRPARYIGGEINAGGGEGAEISLLLSYPDVYEVGMSHLGLQILYDIINRTGWARAERAFAVWEDMEGLMRAKDLPLFSLETFTPAKEFHLWGFSLQAELTYTNILNMLDLAGLPLKAQDRTWPGSPLILGGGAGVTNPEPLAEFFDLFLIGDGEEAILEIVSTYRSLLREGNVRNKEELLTGLVRKIAGLYAPGLYRVEYSPQGRFRGISPLHFRIPRRIKKRVLNDLKLSRVERPLVPLTQLVHDRAVVEIMRGCKRGCRFCQAGWIGRPVREKPKEEVISQSLKLAGETGQEELSLLSLSSGDYREIEGVMEALSNLLARQKVSLALPSLNPNSISDKVLGEVKRVRKSGITLAPEAATTRLQRVINKELKPEILWGLSQKLKKMGWRLLKLYFMIGLPTEQREDVEAIAEVINLISRWGGALNVTISTFIPKPGTPFQWGAMDDAESLRQKQALIRRRVRSRRVKLKFRSTDLSRIEGVLARGDRRLGNLLLAAWEEGCRFDDWQDCFQSQKWERAFQKSSINPQFYLSPPYREKDPLPWSHIDPGVSPEVLATEARKALKEKEENCPVTVSG